MKSEELLSVMVGLFAGMGRILGLEGDLGVTLVLIGLTTGGLMGILALGNSTAGNLIPFALIIVPGVDLLLWVWKGGG